jgi:hypothetical protein
LASTSGGNFLRSNFEKSLAKIERSCSGVSLCPSTTSVLASTACATASGDLSAAITGAAASNAAAINQFCIKPPFASNPSCSEQAVSTSPAFAV